MLPSSFNAHGNETVQGLGSVWQVSGLNCFLIAVSFSISWPSRLRFRGHLCQLRLLLALFHVLIRNAHGQHQRGWLFKWLFQRDRVKWGAHSLFKCAWKLKYWTSINNGFDRRILSFFGNFLVNTLNFEKKLKQLKSPFAIDWRILFELSSESLLISYHRFRWMKLQNTKRFFPVESPSYVCAVL
jgi:hypothetical protein